MADAARAARLADRIKVIVAKALERRVKDPRLGFVTITDARVTNDLQHATLYYTVFGSEEDAANTKKALESAKGIPVSYTHLRAHETEADLVCRLLLEKKKKT